MTQASAFDPIPIGEVAKPPFARLPDPSTMFARRAERLRRLADRHQLRSYLLFVADLCDAQHQLQPGFPDPQMPAGETVARARQFKMPPIDRLRFAPDAATDAALYRILMRLADTIMPAAARHALERTSAADAAAREAMLASVLSDTIPVETLAEHVFVAAALQVHFARLAGQLDVDALVPVAEGVCPACGAPPVSSLVVGWRDAHATRFCACSLCGTLWNYPRIKCTLCGSTKDIAYQEIAGGPGTVKAETCGTCGRYVKILQQHKEAFLDPVADDVATLALDLLMRQSEFRRGSVNPFLLGY
jgi:FdhE protein